ncbi:arylamine N-acetyltransferase [Jeotgalibacillus sp. ET6]|uniref:arylamine N-acetyltransferase n=1 Tax=Jeotgalibacillus sp. ET6 TaxID=3037260 RepID=UPI0024182364|nr:arylamine N-acetyltransferase [Jeotgalibacillus sp. ET6]MDG5472353.1 arylamine N-acetyltransferase [Jeotgalibacillus sp. ET6]
MQQISEDAKKYLHDLNVSLEEPSLPYLERICHAQLNTFPFENISKLILFKKHGYNSFDIPSFSHFVDHHEQYQFGGTCYTLNSNLMRLLKEIGFECYHVMLGEEHMGIIVVINHERFYVDGGAAAPFFKPVSFESDFRNISSFGKDEVYLLPEEPGQNLYKYIRYANGSQSGKTWHFHSRKEAKVEDFSGVIQKSNEPAAPFMTILRCQLYQTDKKRSVSLVNNKFGIRYSNGETVVRNLSTVEEICDVLSEEFQLPKLPVEEAIGVLRRNKIDIFKD